ncbi:MAG: hypothetical protein EAX96_10535 [Candidatus Lokiarchaeota archaeon]|nr:hypothetical protein [Candidatus Lokiarchaeota archaeon]
MIRLLYEKKRIFTFEEFYEICSKKMALSDSEIFSGFHEIVGKKLVIEGSRLIRDEILNHKKRSKIFEYINKNPGFHFTHIISKMGIGPHAGRWHLKILEKFDFIKSRKFDRYKVYFNDNFPESREEMVFLLRKKNALEIFKIIVSNSEINANEIDKVLDLHYNTIQYYVKQLINSNLIESNSRNNVNVLMPVQGHLEFLSMFFDIKPIEVAIKPVISSIPSYSKEQPIELIKTVPLVEKPQDQEVKVIREYDYVGGDVRFKVAVQNHSEFIISKINVMITSTAQYLVDDKVKSIDLLSPGESRGIDFLLTPLTCGKSTIYATISYSDYKGKPQSLVINPKEIWIKCPLVTPKHASIEEILSWKKQLLNGSSSIEYHNVPDSQAFKIALDQISALDLSEIDMDESKKSATFSGIAKVTNDKMIIELKLHSQKINLNVWTSDLKQATGFLAYIKNLINISIENAKRFQIKAEKVGEKILDCFELSDRVKELNVECENRASVSDILLLINEIGVRLNRSFPDVTIVDSVGNWKENLETNFRPGEFINESNAIKLQFEILNWFQKIIDLTKNNLQVIESTFEESDIPLDEIKDKISELNKARLDQEKNYLHDILKYLMIIHKDTGLTLFEKGFFGFKLDPDLVGGFLTAIQSFGSEISSTETSMKKLVYKDFQIEIEDGDYVRAAIILKGESTIYLIKKLLDYVKYFEKKYENQLPEWSGNLQIFKDEDKDLENFFFNSIKKN